MGSGPKISYSKRVPLSQFDSMRVDLHLDPVRLGFILSAQLRVVLCPGRTNQQAKQSI